MEPPDGPDRGAQPPAASGRDSWWHGFRITLLVFTLSTALGLILERQYRLDKRAVERQAVEDRVTGMAQSVSIALSHRLALLSGLRAFLEVNWGRPGLGSDFNDFARKLHGSIPGIRSLQWVQDGVIRQTYPVVGNERATGYNLRADPRAFIREDLARAEAEDGVVLSGPVELVQGGLGLIARLGARSVEGDLLAVAEVVLDLPPILAEAGVAGETDLRLALQDPDRGVFYGDSALLAAAPVIGRVPMGVGSWELIGVPAAGWGAAGRAGLRGVRSGLAALVFLITMVSWLAAGRARARAREKAERERRLGEEKFSRLFALSPDAAILSRVRDRVILEANAGASVTLGISRRELVGRRLEELGLQVDELARDQALDAIRQRGLVRNFPVTVRDREGRLRHWLFSGRSLEVDGEPCLLALIRDATDQRQLEEQLAHAQKLEAVGRLAGGVAHDFNNLITAITGYAEMVRGGLAPDDPRRADTDEILKATGRATGLTQQLLSFARRQIVQPRVVDLNALVRDLVGLLQRLIGADITLTTDLDTRPALVLLDPGQAEQLLVNLAVNARDAMPAGGRLTIATTVGESAVELLVGDTGEGMSEQVRAQAFEPFFTTKEQGRGTGLGLATVYGIIQQAGGQIELDSAPGRGTRVTMRFPRSPHAPEPPAAAPAPASPRGHETILLAEDDPQVRHLAERTLRAAGYQVVAAGDGAAALEAARAWDEPLHLLLTDLVMPIMGGSELATRFQELHPGVPVLFMSGYTGDEVVRRGMLDAGPAFLPKPFTPAELATRVRALLDRREETAS